MIPRHAKARDANEPAVVEALEQAGARVWRLDMPCDLLVAWAGQWLLVEVKMPPGPQGGTSGRGLTPQQKAWHSEAEYRRCQIHIVTSAGEALGLLRQRPPEE